MFKLNLIFMFFLLSIIQLNAQKSLEKKSDKITAQLEFEFTGEVTSTLDSTFIVYCVIDAERLKDYEKLVIKTGKSIEKLTEKQIDLNNKSIVTEKKDKLRIKLGKAGENLSYIEIETINKNGKKTKIHTQLKK